MQTSPEEQLLAWSSSEVAAREAAELDSYEALATGGELPDGHQSYRDLKIRADAIQAGRPVPQMWNTTRLQDYLVDQRGIWTAPEIIKSRDDLLKRVQYRHIYGQGLEPQLEKIPFFKNAGNTVITYADKFRKAQKEKGKDESAEFGRVQIGGHDAIWFQTNYEFMGGSLSAVAGDVFVRACDYAAKHELPLVADYNTGGARQDENTGALFQMPLLASAINAYRQKHPKGVIVSVLHGEVWGGISASSMPLADLRVAYTGTRMGFAGSRVIAASRMDGGRLSERVVQKAQRVEAHAIVRNVDVLVADTDELLDVLGDFIGRIADHGKKDKKPFTEEVLSEQNFDQSLLRAEGRILDIGKTAIVSSVKAIRRADAVESAVVIPRGEDTSQDLDRLLNTRYRNIMYDAARPDTDMFISAVLDHPSQMYNRFVDARGNIYYPGIIAAVGNIGLQPFLVVGHQGSFFKKDSSSQYEKRAAVPSTDDFKYGLRMLKMGERLRLPLITITDTLGAEASIKAEHDGQFEQIAEFLALYDRYPAPVISMVPGLLGSGGGLTMGTRVDSLAMTSRALLMVAETRSAASIVHNVTTPTIQQERETLLGLDPSSDNQLKMGIVDAVIPESDNPYQTLIAMRAHAIATYEQLAKHSLRSLLRERERRMKTPLAFRISGARSESLE